MSVSLSIIIPTVGRPSLSSVLQQLVLSLSASTDPAQVLVVNNQTVETQLIKTLKKKFPHYQWLNQPIAGAGMARNLALDHALGEIIAFLDDDTVPAPSWATSVRAFHQQNPAEKIAALGSIEIWPQWAKDPFQLWAHGEAQFSLPTKKKLLNWKQFYTANVSLKRSFLVSERFSAEFSGWGFEDSELGYRLFQRGLELHFEPKITVWHQHFLTLENLQQKTTQAAKNALIFERLHPEVRLRPKGLKKILLKILIFLSSVMPFSPRIKWWRAWKCAWVEGTVGN